MPSAQFAALRSLSGSKMDRKQSKQSNKSGGGGVPRNAAQPPQPRTPTSSRKPGPPALPLSSSGHSHAMAQTRGTPPTRGAYWLVPECSTSGNANDHRPHMGAQAQTVHLPPMAGAMPCSTTQTCKSTGLNRKQAQSSPDVTAHQRKGTATENPPHNQSAPTAHPTHGLLYM